MKFILITVLTAISLISIAQDDTTKIEKPWKLKSTLGLNMTQSSFTNWAAGGRNNIAGLSFINAEANYKKNNISWSTLLNLSLGGVQYFDEDMQKTDDIIDLQSTFSRKWTEKINFSLLGGFRTQFVEGFSNVGDSLRSSTFLAPGYLNLSLGLEYVPNKHFKIMASPLSGKFTFVRDQRLANLGAFGVEGAEFDNLGNVLSPGKNFRPEFGSYVRIIFSKEIMENIDLRTRWEFFSNYIENPKNIDINAELIMNFKVNKWFSASLQANLIYDDDVDITDRFGNTGPRTQFRQTIGVGIAYRIANFKEKKD
jgi:hypothetical protein